MSKKKMSVPLHDERGQKERAYDAQVFPLMQQIIETCRGAGIGIVASFELDHDPSNPADPMRCTSILPPDNGAEFKSRAMRDGRETLRPERPHAVAVMETTKPDGTRVITVQRLS